MFGRYRPLPLEAFVKGYLRVVWRATTKVFDGFKKNIRHFFKKYALPNPRCPTAFLPPSALPFPFPCAPSVRAPTPPSPCTLRFLPSPAPTPCRRRRRHYHNHHDFGLNANLLLFNKPNIWPWSCFSWSPPSSSLLQLAVFLLQLVSTIGLVAKVKAGAPEAAEDVA